MKACCIKDSAVSLLFRSFYDKFLAEKYVCAGHGIGFSPLFLLSVFSALVYSIYALLFINVFSPEMITEKIVDFPTVEVQNGEIVKPENFFQRFALGNGMHLTLDTTADAETMTDPSPNEIYISKRGVQFMKGHKVELMPLKKLFGTDNITITAENITEFVNKISEELKLWIPGFVFLISIPVLFLKYGVLTYLVALFSYAVTFFFKKELHFEARMRLAAVSILPVLVFNFFFHTLFGLFGLGIVAGIIITLVYLSFYIGLLPEGMEK